jgi:hypothetical protein
MTRRWILLLTVLSLVLLVSGCHRKRYNLRHKWAPAGSCCELPTCGTCCPSAGPGGCDSCHP